MKNRLLLFGLLFLMALPGLGQKHEVGAAGGGMVGYAEGKFNNTTMKGGWYAGAYYRYVPNKWIGAQGGLYYQNFDESGDMLIHRAALHNNLVIPVRAIVFPKFCLSLLGGVYMKNMLGKTVTSDRVYTFWVEPDGSKVPAFDENTKFYALDKKPVWGYEVGFAWNRKHFRMLLSFRKDMNSWMKRSDLLGMEKVLGRRMIGELPKSSTLNLTIEVPLWRCKKP